MKIYIAAHCKWAARYIAAVVVNLGHEVTSRWHDDEFLPGEKMLPEDKVLTAERDIADINAACALILLSGRGLYPGGKFVEAGIAMGQYKPVCIIGKPENILLFSGLIDVAATPEEAISKLSMRFCNATPKRIYTVQETCLYKVSSMVGTYYVAAGQAEAAIQKWVDHVGVDGWPVGVDQKPDGVELVCRPNNYIP